VGHYFLSNPRIYISTCDWCEKWVPVTMAWRVLRLQVEKHPPLWRVAANVLNKQSNAAENLWSSSLGVEQGANNSSP